MTAIDMLTILTESARGYKKDAQNSLQRNNHTNEIKDAEIVQQKHIDAVLVDFINYIGMKHGCDYALYTSDLKCYL